MQLTSVSSMSLKPTDQKLPFEDHLFWQMIVQPNEQFLVLNHFLAPSLPVEAQKLLKLVFG
jgi:hypothetical protein